MREELRSRKHYYQNRIKARKICLEGNLHTGKGNVMNDKRLQWEIVAIPTEEIPAEDWSKQE